MTDRAKRIATVAAVALLLAALPARPALAWGDHVHKLIVRLTVEILPDEVRKRLGLPGREMAAGSVAPDERAKTDRAEGPRQYIDIEMTDAAFLAAWRLKLAAAGTLEGESMRKLRGEFVNAYFTKHKLPLAAAESDRLFRALPETLEGFLGKVGLDGGGWIGTGPYTVGVRYRELVAAIRSGRGGEVRRLAGELSHYVGDLHMPLHLTINYKGQFTRNLILKTKDPRDPSRHCHVRYEVMACRANISRLEKAIQRRLIPASAPPEGRTPTSLAIDAARRAYPLGEKILDADRELVPPAPPGEPPPRSWRAYNREMYRLTEETTVRQIALAVQMTADLICGAYHEAGPPPDVADGAAEAARKKAAERRAAAEKAAADRAAARKAAEERRRAELDARAERQAELERLAEEKRSAERAERARRDAARKKAADEKAKAAAAARKAAEEKKAAAELEARRTAEHSEREAAEKNAADERAKAAAAARKAGEEKRRAELAARAEARAKAAEEKERSMEAALRAAEEKRKAELAEKRSAAKAAAKAREQAAGQRTLYDQAVRMVKGSADRETNVIVLETVAAALAGSAYERRLGSMAAAQRRLIKREAARKQAEKTAAEAEAKAAAARAEAEKLAALEAEKKAEEDAARRSALKEAEQRAAEAEAKTAAERRAAELATKDEARKKAAELAAKRAAERKSAEEARRKAAAEKRAAAEKAAADRAERRRTEREARAAESARRRLDAEAKAAAEAARRSSARQPETISVLPPEPDPPEAAPARALQAVTSAMSRGGVARVSALCTKQGLVGLMKRESRTPGTLAGEGRFLEGARFTWRLTDGKAAATYAPTTELRYEAVLVDQGRGWKLDSCGWVADE